MSKEDMIRTFERRAQKIRVKEIDNKRVFLKKQRRKLLSKIEGEVLEVAVGRGINFQFYSPANTRVVAVDFSPTLLEMAKETASKINLQTDFINSDVEKLKFEENSFDTIVSTLTLCSYEQPVEVLNNFNKWCKPNGIILLLEHGISSNKLYGWFLNKILNGVDDWCLKKMGDHVNRDILKIIEKSKIQVEKIETCLLDTHYSIWAKPNKNR